jgi:hypothetical protein
LKILPAVGAGVKGGNPFNQTLGQALLFLGRSICWGVCVCVCVYVCKDVCVYV